MKTYTVMKQLFSESAGRVFQPGELITLDDAPAAVLLDHGVVAPGEIIKAKRKTKRDAELDKLKDNL